MSYYSGEQSESNAPTDNSAYPSNYQTGSHYESGYGPAETNVSATPTLGAYSASGFEEDAQQLLPSTIGWGKRLVGEEKVSDDFIKANGIQKYYDVKCEVDLAIKGYEKYKAKQPDPKRGLKKGLKGLKPDPVKTLVKHANTWLQCTFLNQASSGINYRTSLQKLQDKAQGL